MTLFLMPLIVMSLCLLVVGIMMIKRGFRSSRRGYEPHCRSCGYILLGIDSQRCPECGTAISPRNTVHGQRVRRHGLAWAGIAAVLLGLALPGILAAMALRNVNWYHYKPTFMVMTDLRSSSPTIAGVAMQELMRRDQAGELSSKYQQQIVEIGLTEQAGTGQGPLTQQLIEYVEQQYMTGHLTDAQRTRFGRQCVIVSLRVRPIVVLGDFVPYKENETFRISSNPAFAPFGVRVVYHEKDCTDDMQHEPSWGGSSESTLDRLESGGHSGSTLECKSVGKHWIQITYHIDLYQGNYVCDNPDHLVYHEDRKVIGNFEVVAQPPEGYFTLIDDRGLVNPIKLSMHPSGFALDPKSGTFEGDISVASPPVNIAFNVFAHFGGREYKAGTIVCNKGTVADYGIGGSMSGIGATTQPATFDLILRSSEKAARETVDQHDIWNGELIFPNLPIRVNQSR
jgi:hypothetical protein